MFLFLPPEASPIHSTLDQPQPESLPSSEQPSPLLTNVKRLTGSGLGLQDTSCLLATPAFSLSSDQTFSRWELARPGSATILARALPGEGPGVEGCGVCAMAGGEQ